MCLIFEFLFLLFATPVSGFAPISTHRTFVRSHPLQTNTRFPSQSSITSSIKSTNNDGEKYQSVGAASFSLVKAIVGSGVLSLPSGLAAMSDVKKAVFPASIFIMILGALSGWSFYLVGRLCHETDANSLGELWDKDIGKKYSWVVTLSTFTFTMGGALAYSIVLGDTFSSLAESMGFTGLLVSRHVYIIAITCIALYPLCNLASLAALAPVSIVGVVGALVTCGFMAFRWLSPSSYALPDGRFLSTLALLPSFNTMGMHKMWTTPTALILASMSACAFQAHYCAPDFYRVLGKSSDAVLSKFKRLTILGFGGVSMINVAVMAFGFLTFGGSCYGNVLNNYSTLDVGASVCRVLMAVSIIGGFPFLLGASRSAFFKLLDKRENEVTKAARIEVTTALITILTGLALILEDAGIVVSFNGAVMGSVLVYLFPCLLFMKSTKNRIQQGTLPLTRRIKFERLAARFLIGFGAILAAVGGVMTIQNAR